MVARNAGNDCYCDLWEKDPKSLEGRGIPRGYCGICDCGAPGHTRHYPGSTPITGSWCDECYGRLPRTPFMTQLYYAILFLLVLGLGVLIWFLLH